MNERSRAEILRAAAETRPTAFVYVNLHNFKPLNVLLGYQRGDEHLVRVQRGLADGRASDAMPVA
jgi:GGDEF domain-containing protein